MEAIRPPSITTLLDQNSQDGLVMTGQNPCLANIPNVPTSKEAMRELACLDKLHKDTKQADQFSLDGVFIPSHQHAQVLISVVAQVKASYAARNLNDVEYRRHTIASNALVHRTIDRHGHRVQIKSGIAPGAVSRGIFVCAGSQMGRRATANAIENFVGRGSRIVRVRIEEQFIEFIQLISLRVSWPIDGLVRTFVKVFLAAFDTEVGTGYSRERRGPFNREDDSVPALCALATAANLGLLIVEKINYRVACKRDAAELWDALAIFTRTTGIPVLLFATPGGTLGLAEQSGTFSDLVRSGLHIIEPSKPGWEKACEAFFKHSIGQILAMKMPDWFSENLWASTAGRYGLATKLCTFVAQRLVFLNSRELNEDTFCSLAKECFIMEEPYLEAARSFEQGGSFKEASLRKYSDWLPLEAALRTMPKMAIAPKDKIASGS